MATHLLTIESNFTRPGVGTILLPYLDVNPPVPRDQPFEVELGGLHGVTLVQAIARDSTVHEFVGGTQTKTFIELLKAPGFDLAGVEVWLRA